MSEAAKDVGAVRSGPYAAFCAEAMAEIQRERAAGRSPNALFVSPARAGEASVPNGLVLGGCEVVYDARQVHVRACERVIGDPGPAAALIAAAPSLTRSLLDVEWIRLVTGYYGETRAIVMCPRCRAQVRGVGPDRHPEAHEDECGLDAALTLAGLDTQEKRDAARAEIAKR